jgi:hypothetical protein
MPTGRTNSVTRVFCETLIIKLPSVQEQIKERYFIVLLPAVVFIERNLYGAAPPSDRSHIPKRNCHEERGA